MIDLICLDADGNTIGHIEMVMDHPMFYAPRLTAHEMRMVYAALINPAHWPFADAVDKGALIHKLDTLLTHLDSEE